MSIDELIAVASEIRAELPPDAAPTQEQLRTLTALAVAVERIESQQVSPFQERILRTLETLSPRESSPPVSTTRLISAVGGLDNRFTAWRYLSDLEARGLVCRPHGPKSGWKARTA